MIFYFLGDFLDFLFFLTKNSYLNSFISNRMRWNIPPNDIKMNLTAPARPPVLETASVIVTTVLSEI